MLTSLEAEQSPRLIGISAPRYLFTRCRGAESKRDVFERLRDRQRYDHDALIFQLFPGPFPNEYRSSPRQQQTFEHIIEVDPVHKLIPLLIASIDEIAPVSQR